MVRIALGSTHANLVLQHFLIAAYIVLFNDSLFRGQRFVLF